MGYFFTFILENKPFSSVQNEANDDGRLGLPLPGVRWDSFHLFPLHLPKCAQQ